MKQQFFLATTTIFLGLAGTAFAAIPVTLPLKPEPVCAAAKAEDTLLALLANLKPHCIGTCTDNYGCQLGCSCSMSGWCE